MMPMTMKNTYSLSDYSYIKNISLDIETAYKDCAFSGHKSYR